MPSRDPRSGAGRAAPRPSRIALRTVPGDLLDLVVIALASAFAVAGYRQGFIIGVLSFVGFTGGALAGIYLAPGIATVLTSRQNLQAVLAIIGVFVAAVAGMLVASAFALLLRSRVTARPSTLLDSIGGAAVEVAAGPRPALLNRRPPRPPPPPAPLPPPPPAAL